MLHESHVAPPTPVAGRPSGLREAVVQTVNVNGTVDLKAIDNRTGWTQMKVPGWYVPSIGDHVYVGDLQGDPQNARVIAPVSGVPMLSKASAAATYALLPPLVTTGSLAAGQGGIPNPIPDGFVVYFLADGTNGIVWNLRYRAASGSAYKWEYVGGPALSAEQASYNSSDSTTSVTFVAPPTNAGPTITVPLAGDYDVSVAGQLQQNAILSYAVGATAAVDDDAATLGSGTATNETVARLRRKTSVAASTQIAARLRATTGTAVFLRRSMTVLPVRVG